MTSITTPALTPEALALLRRFISPQQMAALHQCLQGEERQFFIGKLADLAAMIAAMPVTYQQDDKGQDAIVYLHYFAGGQANWYITEKDAEMPEEPGQHQAFGLADLFNDGGELGYISIVELIQNRAELDLYFKPCTLREIGKRAGMEGESAAPDNGTVMPLTS
jgi:hypothetical protein